MSRTEIERRIRSWTRHLDAATAEINAMAPGSHSEEYNEQVWRWKRAQSALAILNRKLVA